MIVARKETSHKQPSLLFNTTTNELNETIVVTKSLNMLSIQQHPLVEMARHPIMGHLEVEPL